jgi:hypothetical protein
MAAGAPRAVQAHDHGRPHLRQQRGAEAGPEPAPAARAIIGPVAVGRKISGRGREEEEAAGDDGDDAAVERAAIGRITEMARAGSGIEWQYSF